MNVQDVYHMHNCYYWYDTCCMLCMNVHSTMHIHINIYIFIYLFILYKINKYAYVATYAYYLKSDLKIKIQCSTCTLKTKHTIYIMYIRKRREGTTVKEI